MKLTFEWDTNDSAAKFLRKFDAFCKEQSKKDIDWFLNFSSDLWALLTALRGPDDGNDLLKMDTTAIIRKRTMPNIASRKAMVDDRKISKLLDYSDLTGSIHFLNHIRSAVYALGGWSDMDYSGVYDRYYLSYSLPPVQDGE